MSLIPDEFKRINGHMLKLIACISMLIDHIAAGLLLPVIKNKLYPEGYTFEQLSELYKVMRALGRTAFPIFCFLLVEGFVHTRNRLRYALSLLIFGLISEPFFDATFFAKKDIFNLNIIELLVTNKNILQDRCNVYFTLLLGFLTIWAADTAIKYLKKSHYSAITYYSVSIIVCLCGIWVAERMHTDYHGYGIALIFVFYMTREIEIVNLLSGYLAISTLGTEYLAYPGFILMLFYNKKRGRKLGAFKYLFYAFYPVHIGIIFFFRCVLFG